MVRVPDASAAIRLAVRLIGEVGTRHGSLACAWAPTRGRPSTETARAAVNLAARVAGVAQRGEVLMTEATHSAAGGALAEYDIETRPGRPSRTWRSRSRCTPDARVTAARGQPRSIRSAGWSTRTSHRSAARATASRSGSARRSARSSSTAIQTATVDGYLSGGGRYCPGVRGTSSRCLLRVFPSESDLGYRVGRSAGRHRRHILLSVPRRPRILPSR